MVGMGSGMSWLQFLQIYIHSASVKSVPKGLKLNIQVNTSQGISGSSDIIPRSRVAVLTFSF